MARAIELATAVNLARDVNPHVGAVIVSSENEIIGEGFHRGSGNDHAEAVAITQAGSQSHGATLYTTLEPCNATGKRPPCVDGIISAGISHVVIAQKDPHQAMAGGAKRLRDAGIEVTEGVLVHEATALNSSWTFAHLHQRPWVIWKTATTIDGFISIKGADTPWITCDESREMVQRIRATVGAIITGTGTVMADNPRLTVRALHDDDQPMRVVVGHRPIDPHANVLQGSHPALLKSEDIQDVIVSLWTEHGIHKVLVEAGAGLSTSLWHTDLIDEVYWFQAPTIAGAGIRVLGDIGVNTVEDIRWFSQIEVNRVGLDVVSHFTTKKE